MRIDPNDDQGQPRTTKDNQPITLSPWILCREMSLPDGPETPRSPRAAAAPRGAIFRRAIHLNVLGQKNHRSDEDRLDTRD